MSKRPAIWHDEEFRGREDELICLSEAGRLAGVSPTAVSNWRARQRDFPPVVASMPGSGPVATMLMIELVKFEEWLAAWRAGDPARRLPKEASAIRGAQARVERAKRRLDRTRRPVDRLKAEMRGARAKLSDAERALCSARHSLYLARRAAEKRAVSAGRLGASTGSGSGRRTAPGAPALAGGPV